MTNPDHLRLLHSMLRVRRMEELCAELYTQEKIRGFLHLYIGEEAVVTGVMSLLRPQDNVMATYREHGHALLKGVSAKLIMAEMFGKVEGCSKGRGGSMHLISAENRFFGGNAIVAAGIPQAAGLALAAKRHETMNMAALWKIPILFCCENNLYAMGTALSRSQSQQEIVKKAESYNIAAVSVDGMNIFDVIEKTHAALDFVKREQKPYFLEFKTYRFRPHSMFDPELYRKKEEVQKWKERCPIDFLTKYLIEHDGASQDVLNKLKIEVEQEMQDAVSFAENGTLEPVENLEKNIYENDL